MGPKDIGNFGKYFLWGFSIYRLNIWKVLTFGVFLRFLSTNMQTCKAVNVIFSVFLYNVIILISPGMGGKEPKLEPLITSCVDSYITTCVNWSLYTHRSSFKAV